MQDARSRAQKREPLRACLSEFNFVLDWHRVEQSLDAGQAGRERDACGGDVQTAGAVPQQPTPMHEPAEAAFYDPTAREHDEACLSGVTLDYMVAHAMPVRPLVAARCGEGPIQDRLPQAGPRRLAWIKSFERVAVLHRGGDDRDGEPSAVGINQSHALAPEHFLVGVVPTGTAHRDALDRLRVDDAQAGLGPAARGPAASAGPIA